MVGREACKLFTMNTYPESNRVNVGSKPGQQTFPEKSRLRADEMISRLVRKTSTEGVSRKYGTGLQLIPGPAVYCYVHVCQLYLHRLRRCHAYSCLQEPSELVRTCSQPLCHSWETEWRMEVECDNLLISSLHTRDLPSRPCLCAVTSDTEVGSVTHTHAQSKLRARLLPSWHQLYGKNRGKWVLFLRGRMSNICTSSKVSICEIVNTTQSRYNMVNFLNNIHKDPL